MTEATLLDTATPTAAQRIARRLKHHGVEVIFGQSLPSALILACEDLGIRQFVYRTENAGGAMADGFARVSGKIGIVTAQNGPAATLLVPPLAEAMKASVPVLALVQDVNRDQVDRNAFQELDHITLFASCTKYARRVADPARVEEYIDAAIIAATSGRAGPAVLMLPADMLISNAPKAPFPRAATLGRWPLERPAPDPEAIATAAAMIAHARHPIVIAGGGVHAARAYAALEDLQDYGLPVAYTMMGKGAVSDRHPMTIGLIGNAMGRHSLGRHMRPLVQEADVVLLVGTRTNQNGTDNWTLLPPSAQIIQIDIDPMEIGRTYEAKVRISADARASLEALAARLRDLWPDHRRSTQQSLAQRIAAARQDRATEIAPLIANQGRLRPEQVMAYCQELLDDDAVVAADASYSSIWITAFLEARRAGQRFIAPRGLAGLGWGLPLAMGAKLASPGSRVVCVVGDGGFGHCWSELETLKRMGCAVTLLVLNNSLLGFQMHAELVKFGRFTSAIHFGAVDHAAIARACGLPAHRVETVQALRDALSTSFADDETTHVIDVICDPEAVPPLTMFDGKFAQS
ncbi:acetolactate synthase catalytic subunit [Peristeroidobacter soli]|uniref:acetolactate synthase catalytic subunit n=1 Tax=Peristeroidobacter soli TaxID=2497877 RepID=UPI00101DDED2|nr:acetolactate synthase catalytic subunit [Peristeroidobacter soli]